MRVIFLDFDGVMVNRKSLRMGRIPYGRISYNRADPLCVRALNRIIEKSGARIVVSSAWRRGRFKTVMLEFLNQVLETWGVNGRVIGMTPVLDGLDAGKAFISVTRGKEILAWLILESKRRAEPINYVILDDDGDMGELAPRHVQTTFEIGLTETDADRALHLFGI